MIVTISTTKYNNLMAHCSQTNGYISNEKHLIIIDSIKVIEEVFSKPSLVVRIEHSHCLECSSVGKNCTGEFLINDFL